MEKLKFPPRFALLFVLQIMLPLVLVMQPIQAETAAGNPPAEAGRGVPRDRFSWLSSRLFLEGDGGKAVAERVPYSTLPAPTANFGRRTDNGPPQQVTIPPAPPLPYVYRERPERPTCPRCQIP